MHRRIAREFARIEKKKFKKPLTEDEIYALIERFGKIIPQGSPMYGIGNRFQTISLSNCFVIGAPLDSYGAILQADEMLAQISKRRGGNGVDIENIRPAGTVSLITRLVRRQGTIPFCGRFSNTISEVGQNGRRGALMISQNIHHPESVILWDPES
jgi:ribonucleoside-diphosphate reductase alpha chain